MKRIFSFIFLLSITCRGFFFSNSFAQDYVHYATLKGHELDVDSLAFSPDGSTLASGGFRKLILWDVVTGRHKTTLAGHTIRNGRLQSWVKSSHKTTLAGHTSSVENIAFSPDGRKLVSSGSTLDDSIYLWDTISGVHLKTLREDPPMGVSSLVFSPDGRMLAAGGVSSGYPNPGIIILWDAATGKLKKTLTGHSLSVESIAFSPDSRTLASGSHDDTIRLWDVVTGQCKKILTGHKNSVTSIAFSPDGRTLASASHERSVQLWDAATGKHKITLTPVPIGRQGTLGGIVGSVAFSPDGLTLAGGAAYVHLWNTATGHHKKRLTDGATSVARYVVFNPNGNTLASGMMDIDLWNVHTGAHLQTLTGNTRWISSLLFSPNGQVLASGNHGGTIQLWRVSPAQSVDTNLSTSLKPSADHIYNNAIRSVMWIVNPGIGEGSGVLIDKQFKLAITNAHVTGKQNIIDVYFPAPDENGELIKDRNFYLTSKGVLKRLGYYTKGYIVARDEETDLAIIRLDGLPETAREVDWSFTTPATNSGDLVYILGNPGRQDLWRWTLGEFLNDQGNFLHIQSDVFGGNSGGPVLNKKGILLGIVARSDRHMNALAIPTRDINQLLSESQLEHSRSLR